jgi:hypothetical protein
LDLRLWEVFTELTGFLFVSRVRRGTRIHRAGICSVGSIVAMKMQVDCIDDIGLSLLKRDLVEWHARAPDTKTPDSNEEDKCITTTRWQY